MWCILLIITSRNLSSWICVSLFYSLADMSADQPRGEQDLSKIDGETILSESMYFITLNLRSLVLA